MAASVGMVIAFFAGTAFAQGKPAAPNPAPTAAAPKPPKPAPKGGKPDKPAPVPNDKPPASAPPAPAPAPAAAPDVSEEQRKAEAKAHFEKGLELMAKKQHDLALSEFLASREIFPSRGNTQNAAVCLRELGRSDEALDLFDALLKEFANLTPEQRKDIGTEIGELRAKVGTIEVLVLEPDADVLVDGRRRGKTPLSASIRAGVGPHVVRVYKAGFAPFEARVVVSARQNTQVDGTLQALTQSGELKVLVSGNEAADVVVDGIVMGPAPWSGNMAVGPHSVVLRAAGDRGTAPVAAKVKVGETTALTLELKLLDAELRIEPTPINALVAMDGVELGRGIWDGKLPSGAHTIEVAADGFLPVKRSVDLAAKEQELLRIELSRDEESALWAEKTPSRVIFDLHAAPAIAPLFAGDFAADAGGLGLGALAMLRGGYQFGFGLSISLEAGFLWLQQSIEERAGTLSPRGIPVPNPGTINDHLRLFGLVAGAGVGYQTLNEWPFSVRASGGVLFGSVRDERSGTFTSLLNDDGRSYDVGPIAESTTTIHAYVSPELGIGYRFTENVSLRLVAQAFITFAIDNAKWTDENDVLAGPCDGVGPCEGLATFGEQEMLAPMMVIVTPGLGLELAF